MSALALYKTLATDVSPPAKKVHLQVNVSKILLDSEVLVPRWKQQHQEDSCSNRLSDKETHAHDCHADLICFVYVFVFLFFYSNTVFVFLPQCDHLYNSIGTR